jgi:hypothetical protein
LIIKQLYFFYKTNCLALHHQSTSNNQFMKKLLSIFAFALCIATIAPSCSSADEGFEDIVLKSDLDQTAPTNGDDETDNTPGGGD